MLLHFAHFEKEAQRLDEKHYRVTINYWQDDETELVTRVLSFGPFIKVTEPERFVGLIKKRLECKKLRTLLSSQLFFRDKAGKF